MNSFLIQEISCDHIYKTRNNALKKIKNVKMKKMTLVGTALGLFIYKTIQRCQRARNHSSKNTKISKITIENF